MPSATVSPPEGLPLASPGAGPSTAAFKLLNGSAPASPSLATYSAPEELEGGSTTKNIDYFDQPVLVEEEEDDDDDDDDEDDEGEEAGMEEQMRQYFRDRTDAEAMVGEEAHTESEDDEDEEELPELELIRDEDDEDDERELGPGPEEVERRGNGHANPQQDIAQMPDLNEDLEGNLDDDMDGILEAVGLRGPFLTVLQNAALMVFVLDTTIGLGIWAPFTIGKSSALLSLNPRRMLQIVHFPIKAIRLVTDPVVDSVLYFVLAPMLKSLQRLFVLNTVGFLYLISRPFGADVSASIVEKVSHAYIGAQDIIAQAQTQASELLSPNKVLEAGVDTNVNSCPSLLSFDGPIGQVLEPYFASLGWEVRTSFEGFKATWVRLTFGNGPLERTFAICLGYSVVAFGLAIYMNVLTVGTVKSAGKAVRMAVRQQLLVVKVAAFIIIELIIFPLGCGIALDACTLWFFPEANLRARLVFVRYAPLTTMFHHWVIGTMFMYLFAILLGGCRQIMRPGAMWFIKDPQNQNMHPIRDILDRPTFTHLYKLFQSAVMYALVVTCGVAQVAGLVQLLAPTLLPLRWKPREPLSTVPYDLVFLHLVLPYTIHYFRPRKATNEIGVFLWQKLSPKFRLSSYMFGGRYPEEETPSKSFGGWVFGTGTKGSWRRVPASDNVAMVRNMRATAEVDEHGVPVNQKEQMMVTAQNAEAVRNKRNPEEDYTVVYIPPHFRYRIGLFILCVWSMCCLGIAALATVPVLLGRQFFSIFTSREIHDGYSFIVGFHLLWACWVVGRAVDRLNRRRRRKEGDRASWPLFITKRTLLWAAKASYMAFFLVVVIPSLIAMVVELYIIFPVRSIYNPDIPIRIRLTDMWVLGLFYTKIVLRLPGFEAPHQMNDGIQRINRNGWTRPDPITATKEVIAPTVGGLVGMLLFPPAILWICAQITPLPINERTLFVNVYPAIFAGAGVGRGIWGLYEMYLKWSQSVRDKEFLVEMRLRNLEAEDKENAKKTTMDNAEAIIGDDKSDIDSDEER